jgi:uncharacterized protein YraI
MLGRISLWTAGAVVAGLMLSSPAMAQFDAYTRADLNLRVGPGTQYGVIDVIPAGYPVEVYGCLEAYEWCDINWDGLRGWVSARYLVQPGTTVYLPQYAPRIGVPIISFSFGAYHDRYYRDRPWYRERHGRWRGRDWRDRDRDRGRDRDRDRAEQREERREAEQPRRQREAEQPRRQREAEQPRRQREAEQPRRQREAEQPRRQREAQPEEREARPRLGDGTQQQDQRRQRRDSGGEEEPRPRLGN